MNGEPPLRRYVPGADILFGNRTGGVSAAPFDSANMGFGRGDDPVAVTENRRRLGTLVGGRATEPALWSCLHQVHGATVVEAPLAPGPAPQADAVVSAEAEAVLSILTADCAPVALVAPGAVGAVHAGWRGLLAGVVEAAVAGVRRLGGGPVRAVLGPCVHPSCYEFSASDLAPLVERYGASVAGQTHAGGSAFDLPGAVRVALAGSGVTELDDVGVCTACSPGYFSHRRDGRGGLQAMLVAARRESLPCPADESGPGSAKGES